jgi:hypothetical protein
MSAIATFIDLKAIEAPETKNILKRVGLKEERLKDIVPFTVFPKTILRKYAPSNIYSEPDQHLPDNSLFTYATSYYALF